MTDLCIITARGNSKRIPHKNIKDFLGKPIISYSIQTALESNLFKTVMVSTDSEEIAEIAIGYGASVPFMRSADTSNDYATTADVLFETLNEFNERGETFNLACCIYPTAPFVTSKQLIQARSMLAKDPNCSSVIVAAPFPSPPQRGLLRQGDQVAWWHPEHERTRSQDLPTIYYDAGQFYYFRTEDFLRSKSLVMSNTKALIVPETEVQDIDNPDDWDLAEMKYTMMAKRHSN